jgi:hypothetical protein
MNEVVDERLMTIADLSTMLGGLIDTLYGWRHRDEGPRGYGVGRHVRYRRSASRPGWRSRPTDASRRGSRRMAHIERCRIRPTMCH